MAKRVAAKAGGKGSETKVMVTPIHVRLLTVGVIGTSPLIVHPWSKKAKEEMERRQREQDTRTAGGSGKRAKRDGPRNPEQEYRDCLREITPGHYGFPASGFKHAMVDACRFVQNMTMTAAKGSFFVMGDLVEIKGKPRMREDMVRVPPGDRGSADIRYRAEFPTWETELTIRYDADQINEAEIVNLINRAGFHQGIGEQRPSSPKKSGSNGQFKVKEGRTKRSAA